MKKVIKRRCFPLIRSAFCIFLAIGLCISSGRMEVAADTVSETVSDTEATVAVGSFSSAALLADELRYAGCDTPQAYIDGPLTIGSGLNAEWWVLSLAQSGEKVDLSGYADALLEKVSQKPPTSAASRQKAALALIASGRKDCSFVETTAAESIGRGGIMSYIFGLHLVASGCDCGKWNEDALLDQLLSLRLEDGGWAIGTGVSDVDVTAMTIQALAYAKDRRSDVSDAIEEALILLEGRQLEEGDFSSFGVANAESTAQVILAVCSVGISPSDGVRFSRGGKTLLDGLTRYRLSEGGFAHTVGGSYDSTATVQAYMAVLATEREGGFYPILAPKSETETPSTGNPDRPGDSGTVTLPDVTVSQPMVTNPTLPKTNPDSSAQIPSTSVVDPEDRGGQGVDLRLIGTMIIVGAALTVGLIFWKKGRRSPLYYLLILGVSLGLTLFLWQLKIERPEDYYGGEEPTVSEGAASVRMSIRCDILNGVAEADKIPDGGIILEPTEFSLRDGESVYDLLIRAARAYEILIENNGTQTAAYIAGINGLYEFDYGDLSGWVYFVNGKRPSVGCSAYQLSDGDEIVWCYTMNLGDDLNMD